ncbi:hypothetical protein LUW76_39725 [Actinomadura madurae]|uniref:hypothetical protein n=1 Tax=Actinomadura madurae TaxID=1993 RepID=UPI002026E61D|nr:hypothetical protein [Actinomadura madurae]URM99957.1 hypothetical protein LUW76_39725 [Actinomadura madurae]
MVVDGGPAVGAALLSLEHRADPYLAQLAAAAEDVLVVHAEPGELPFAAVADLVEQVAHARLRAQLLDRPPRARGAFGHRPQQRQQRMARQFEDGLQATDGAQRVGALGPGPAALPVAQRGQADGDALLLQAAPQRVEAQPAGLDGGVKGDVERTVLEDL